MKIQSVAWMLAVIFFRGRGTLAASVEDSVIVENCPKVSGQKPTDCRMKRTFRVSLPPGAEKSGRKFPVLFVFHGGRGTGEKMERGSGFEEAAEARDFIRVYPNGYENCWNDARGTTQA